MDPLKVCPLHDSGNIRSQPVKAVLIVDKVHLGGVLIGNGLVVHNHAKGGISVIHTVIPVDHQILGRPVEFYIVAPGGGNTALGITDVHPHVNRLSMGRGIKDTAGMPCGHSGIAVDVVEDRPVFIGIQIDRILVIVILGIRYLVRTCIAVFILVVESHIYCHRAQIRIFQIIKLHGAEQFGLDLGKVRIVGYHGQIVFHRFIKAGNVRRAQSHQILVRRRIFVTAVIGKTVGLVFLRLSKTLLPNLLDIGIASGIPALLSLCGLVEQVLAFLIGIDDQVGKPQFGVDGFPEGNGHHRIVVGHGEIPDLHPIGNGTSIRQSHVVCIVPVQIMVCAAVVHHSGVITIILILGRHHDVDRGPLTKSVGARGGIHRRRHSSASPQFAHNDFGGTHTAIGRNDPHRYTVNIGIGHLESSVEMEQIIQVVRVLGIQMVMAVGGDIQPIQIIQGIPVLLRLQAIDVGQHKGGALPSRQERGRGLEDLEVTAIISGEGV